MAKVIGIIGSRRRDSREDKMLVTKAFKEIFKDGDWICSGGCPKGGDAFAKWLHVLYATPYLEFPADWDRHGKAAGFVRNGKIAKFSHVLIACVSEDRKGGTEDTITKFKKMYPDREVIIC